MKRKKPSFNETYHGYRTFSELLEDMERHGVLELDEGSAKRNLRGDRIREEEVEGPPKREFPSS